MPTAENAKPTPAMIQKPDTAPTPEPTTTAETESTHVNETTPEPTEAPKTVTEPEPESESAPESEPTKQTEATAQAIQQTDFDWDSIIPQLGLSGPSLALANNCVVDSFTDNSFAIMGY